MNSIINVLISTAKARITPIVTKIRLYTSWNFIRTQLIVRLRNFFNSILNVRPRDKNDYYGIFGWLVSKRLTYALVAIAGIACLYYIVCISDILPSSDAEAVKSYDYNSIMLRFTSDTVRINASDGHLAYEGEVASGSASGSGTLYNADGIVVYQGNFDNSKYEGSGKRYYDDGTLMYSGNFEDNEFSGSGRLYRDNGTVEYDGEFSHGEKDGSGVLYDVSGSQVYSGFFSGGEIVYSELLGNTASEVSESYTGARTVYEQDDEYAVYLEDIDALYRGPADPNTLDEEIVVDQIYVLKDSFYAGGNEISSADELKGYFGEIADTEERDLSLAEAVSMSLTTPSGVDLDTSSEFDDYLLVNGWEGECETRICESNGLRYTFVFPEGKDAFSFYIIEKEAEA